MISVRGDNNVINIFTRRSARSVTCCSCGGKSIPQLGNIKWTNKDHTVIRLHDAFYFKCEHCDAIILPAETCERLDEEST